MAKIDRIALVVTGIRAYIEYNNLGEGDQLPHQDEMAKILGLNSTSPYVDAVAHMKANGELNGIKGVGVFVRKVKHA